MLFLLLAKAVSEGIKLDNSLQTQLPSKEASQLITSTLKPMIAILQWREIGSDTSNTWHGRTHAGSIEISAQGGINFTIMTSRDL